MVAVLVRLKLRLLRNSLRGGGPRVVLTVLAIPFALMIALTCFALTAVLRTIPLADAADVSAVLAVGLALMWVISPIYLFASDNTLDPARMMLLPLRLRDLMPGLAVAAWVGVPPLATLLALSGTTIGLGRSPAAIAVAAAGVLLAAAFSVFLSRAVATASATVLRSRRGRDLGTLLTVVSLGSVGALMAVIPSLLAQRGVFDAVAAVCRWLPPGAAIHAGADAAAENWALLAADLAIALTGVVAALVWWSRGMRAGLTTSGTATQSRREGPATALFPRALAWLPSTRGAAVFARELRYAARSPYRRASIALGVVTGTFLGFSPVLLGTGSSGSVFAGCWIAAVYAVSHGNPLGYEGRSLWLHHSVPGRTAPDWAGRISAAVAIGAVPAIAVSILAAAFTGRWSWLPATIGLSVAILAIECGVGAILGVLLPYAMPDVDANPFSTGAGGGVRAIVALLVSAAAVLVLGSPIIALIVAGSAGWAPGFAAAGLVGVLFSPLLVIGAGRLAGALQDRRAPEVLAVVAPRS